MNKKILGMLVLGSLLGGGAVGAFQVSAQTNFALPIAAEDEQNINEPYEKSDVAITGSALEKASAVALVYFGEGRVTETEVKDEDSYYEVEVTLPDSSEVDVQLDENFNVVDSERDGANDRD